MMDGVDGQSTDEGAETTASNNSTDTKIPSKQILSNKKKKKHQKKKVKENTLNNSETPTSDLKGGNVEIYSLNSNNNFTETELKVNIKENVKIFSLNSNMSKYYMVNDTMFEDTEPTMISDEEYHNYKLYKVMKMENEKNDDELTEDDLIERLFVTEEVMKQGLIINNNVYLTHEQWHTIRQVTKDLYSCSVCQVQRDEQMVAEHMRSETHLVILGAHPPLKRFDLSIIRKINENLHCAVCNVIFAITSYRDHEDSTTHEESLLSAINKVSDIMWDSQDNATTPQTQMFSSNNIREPNNAPYPRNIEETTPEESWIDRYMWDINSSEDRNTFDGNIRMLNMDLSTDINTRNIHMLNTQFQDNDMSVDRNIQMLNMNSTYTNTRNIRMLNMDLSTDINTRNIQMLNNQFPNDMSVDRNIQMQNMDSSTDTQNMDLENSKDTKTDVVDNSKREHGFKFGKYSDVKIYEEDEIEEYVLPIEGVSYAKMASRPVLKVPKYLKIDLGTKEVRVKFESWNMITLINPNEYYCMVCNKKFQVRLKVTHCMAHKEVLTKCHVVGAFEDYLIRDVSQKLYHCGHCNNLQYKSDMHRHIEKYHPLKNAKNLTENRPPLDSVLTKTDSKEFDPKNASNQNTIKPNMDITDTIKSKLDINEMKPVLDIFGTFKFSPFGVPVTVSHLACHTIMLGNNMFFCAICNIYIQGDLVKHVFEPTHKQLINMTPFIRPFECHLTRAIRGLLHCGICNKLVPVNKIKEHNLESDHANKLAAALGMVKKIRPTQEVKYQREERSGFTDMDKFLSTLPPETRGVLSNLKIKNHKGDMFQLSDTSSSSQSTSNSGTPTPMSINNSPIHTKIATPNEISDVSYPKIGAESNPIENEDLIGYPKLKPVKQPSLVNVSHPPTGAGINPYVYYPKSVTDTSNMYHPKIGVEGNTNNLTGAPLLKTGQMMTVSMLEAGLVQARNNAMGAPISPRNPNDIEVANELMSYNQKGQSIKVNAPIDSNVIGNILENKCIGKGKGQEKASIETHKTEPKKKKVSIESDEELLLPFILEEVVFLKIKSAYYKVTSTSYHTLVHHGNGTRRCFLCACHVTYAGLRRHVTSGEHIDKIAKNKFLYNCGHLFRQMYQMYHCAICNVTVSRNEIQLHLNWSTHIAKYEAACKKISKTDLKEAIKAGAKEVLIETQKEVLYPNVTDKIVTIVTYIQSKNVDFEEVFVEKKIDKKSQMVILKGNMLKISFDSWHGLQATKNGVRCIICQQEIPEDSIRDHLEMNYHKDALGLIFEKQYYPTLIRKINKNTVNCVICNLELLNDDSMVLEHIKGRKHDKNYNAIIEKTLRTDIYSDCYKNPITL